MAGKKYYAVKQGRQTGIFTSWDICKEKVQGYSGAVYKGFATLEEAEAYLHASKETSATETQTKQANPTTLADGEMVAYVDGSFSKEKRRYAFGAVLFYAGKEFQANGSDTDENLLDMQNVAGEIMGATYAIAFALKQQARVLHMYHDYEGISRWCTGEWQAKKPGTQAYRSYYLEAQALGLTIVFHKVQGHSGDKYNELADQLAKAALA